MGRLVPERQERGPRRRLQRSPRKAVSAGTAASSSIKDTENFRHAHEFIEAWSSTASAEWIIPNYAYGHANTAVDLTKVPADLVEVFHLDDPKAREEPRAHYARPVPTADRARYASRWDEVKAA